MTWEEAYVFCLDHDARMMEFYTETQMEFLKLIIGREISAELLIFFSMQRTIFIEFLANEADQYYHWLGATDFGNEGTYEWIESRKRVGDFAWASSKFTRFNEEEMYNLFL